MSSETTKNWLTNTLKAAFNRTLDFKDTTQHPDEPVYQLMQPCGLTHGLSLGRNQDDKIYNQANSYFLEAMICIYRSVTTGEVSESDCILKIHDFLKGLYPDLNSSIGHWFGTGRDYMTVTEVILSKRTSKLLSKTKTEPWPFFYNHAQLFLDVFLFRMYCFADNGSHLLGYLREQKDRISFTMLNVIAAAAGANKEVLTEVRSLSKLFAEYNFLSQNRKKTAIQVLEKDSKLESIFPHDTDSWALKKLYLELAIITVWSNGSIDELENNFINRLAHLLKLKHNDKELSFIAVESFFLERSPGTLPLMSVNRKDIEHCFINRLRVLLSAYDREIIRCILKDSHMATNLKRAAISNMSSEVKLALSKRLIFVIERLPIFRNINLPANALTYEAIVIALPKSVVKAVVAST